jgi:carboxyl-terminal processing protease
MVSALGDTNHSRFLDPEDARQFMDSTRGELIGIGVNIDVSELPLRVIMPIKGSPAYDAGVKPGDVILAIDGVDVSQMGDPQEAIALIRGEAGTDITLLVQREGSDERAELTMTRSTVVIEPVSWAMLPGDVLWVRIDQFSKGATDGLQTALQAGLDAGAQGLVLDLRANPGGLVLEAMGVGGLLQPKGSVLFQQKSADGGIEEIVTSDRGDRWTDRPIVVLIDGDSASAAEIVASSLAENGRATLVGETTSGTGTVLLPVELEDGSIVLIGTELWLTPSGQVIWHNGVAPARSVTNPPDVQIAVPFLFDDTSLSDGALAETGDEQLLAAHQEMLGIIQSEEAGTPQASPVAPNASPSASPVPAVGSPEATATD